MILFTKFFPMVSRQNAKKVVAETVRGGAQNQKGLRT